MAREHGYPAARERAAAPRPSSPLVYTNSEVVRLADADNTAFVEVGRFSGQPDAIDLASVAEAHRVRLRNRNGAVIGEYMVPAGETLPTFQSAEVIEAQANAATAGRIVSATGKWAAPVPPMEQAEPVPGSA